MRLVNPVVVIAAVAGNTCAFAPPSSSRSLLQEFSTISLNVKAESTKDVSYGETSRQFRRTVYTHDEWVKHRSSDRFIRNLKSLTKSGIYKNIGNEVLASTLIASFIVAWNVVFGGYTDFSGVAHDPAIPDTLSTIGLPLNPFTLSSPALALLLVFRTNTSYKRWDEARKNWGMNINHTRDLVRMATVWYDPKFVDPTCTFDINEDQPSVARVGDMTPEELQERKEKLENLSLATWAFVRSMKRHLSPVAEDEENFQEELYQKLPRPQAQKVIEAAHRPNRALQDLSVAIEDIPMHFIRKNEIHKAVTIFEDNLGSSERLLSSPVPLFYTRHTARFIAVWLFLLPLALYEPFNGTWNHIGMIPATAIISVFMFGIEEIGIQLEEPFTVLPMQAYCDKIGNWCNEIVSFTPGDNELFTVPKSDEKPPEKTEERLRERDIVARYEAAASLRV